MKKFLSGLNITYRYQKTDFGNTETVLLLHGWGGSLNSFRFLENQLAKEGFSVITLDFPGFGGSDLPREDFSLDDYKKIVEELVEKENIKSVHIIAHSFGGRVAIKLSAETNLVKKLVLVDSAGIKPRFSLAKNIKILHYKFLKSLKKIGLIKRDLNNFGSADYKAMPNNLKSVFNRIVNEDLSGVLHKIECPTLIVWGRNDRETPLYMAKKLNKGIKDSAIVTFDGGHFAYLQNAEKFTIIVKEFLK